MTKAQAVYPPISPNHPVLQNCPDDIAAPKPHSESDPDKKDGERNPRRNRRTPLAFLERDIIV